MRSRYEFSIRIEAPHLCKLYRLMLSIALLWRCDQWRTLSLILLFGERPPWSPLPVLPYVHHDLTKVLHERSIFVPAAFIRSRMSQQLVNSSKVCETEASCEVLNTRPVGACASRPSTVKRSCCMRLSDLFSSKSLIVRSEAEQMWCCR